MAARRLLIAMVAFLVVSSLLAALAPPPSEEDDEATEEAQTTTDERESTPSGRVVERTVRVPAPDIDGGPRQIELQVGDELRLEIRSDATRPIVIEELGIRRTAAPGGPVRVSVFADRARKLSVEALEPRLELARIEITPADGDDSRNRPVRERERASPRG